MIQGPRLEAYGGSTACYCLAYGIWLVPDFETARIMTSNLQLSWFHVVALFFFFENLSGMVCFFGWCVPEGAPLPLLTPTYISNTEPPSSFSLTHLSRELVEHKNLLLFIFVGGTKGTSLKASPRNTTLLSKSQQTWEDVRYKSQTQMETIAA